MLPVLIGQVSDLAKAISRREKLLVSSGKKIKIHLLPTHINLDTIKKMLFKM